MHIRAVFWKKLLVDNLIEDNSRHLELAFESSAAIVALAGFEQSERSIELRQRIAAGELSFDKAVDLILNRLADSQ